jgi:hypothetical protein
MQSVWDYFSMDEISFSRNSIEKLEEMAWVDDSKGFRQETGVATVAA